MLLVVLTLKYRGVIPVIAFATPVTLAMADSGLYPFPKGKPVIEFTPYRAAYIVPVVPAECLQLIDTFATRKPKYACGVTMIASDPNGEGFETITSAESYVPLIVVANKFPPPVVVSMSTCAVTARGEQRARSASAAEGARRSSPRAPHGAFDNPTHVKTLGFAETNTHAKNSTRRRNATSSANAVADGVGKSGTRSSTASGNTGACA